MAKAEQFLSAAEVIEEFAGKVADAYVTLCVHAGIAAADVICCVRLGRHSQGDNHNEAISLLEKARVPEAAKQLNALLGVKTKAGYSHTPSSAHDVKRAGRSAKHLVEIAQRVAAQATD